MADGIDVFISYAHEDNVPLIENVDGWVTKFHRALKVRLDYLLIKDQAPKIWRDDKLRGYDEFSDEIISKLREANILVAIISPHYIKSDWCMRELRKFIEFAEERGGVRVGNKSRIFKIIKNHVDYEKYPDEIRGLKGYEFFHSDKIDENCRPHEFILEKNSPHYHEFCARLYNLADDIVDLIENRGNQQVNPPEKTVYLAETTSDLTTERENIQRCLKQQGCTILPDRPLPLLLKDGNLRDTIRAYLERCKLSIHLIGKQYGLIPEGEEGSIIDLQNELASKQCKNNKLKRLIWMPPGLEKNKKDERQERFITDLRNNAPQVRGTELLEKTTKLEKFKTIIEVKLEKINKPQQEDSSGPPRVYLVYNKRDRENVESVSYCFRKEEFEILNPFSEGSAAQREKLHEDYLSLCDAMMIYYNHGSAFWMETKLNDIRKARGLERKKPLKGCVFITGKKTEHKNQVSTIEAKLIKDYDPCFCEALNGFIDQIRGREVEAAVDKTG